MALGPSLTTVTITGNYIDYEGNAVEGQIRFTTVDVLRNGTDDQMVTPSTVIVPLSSGSFSVVLPATNDPDVVPNPFVYTVEESFIGGRVYTISVPYTTSGSLDLADISPTPTILTPYVSLIDNTTWTILETNIGTLNTNFPSLGSISAYVSAAQASAVTANNNATSAATSFDVTMNPMLLIGG